MTFNSLNHCGCCGGGCRGVDVTVGGWVIWPSQSLQVWKQTVEQTVESYTRTSVDHRDENNVRISLTTTQTPTEEDVTETVTSGTSSDLRLHQQTTTDEGDWSFTAEDPVTEPQGDGTTKITRVFNYEKTTVVTEITRYVIIQFDSSEVEWFDDPLFVDTCVFNVTLSTACRFKAFAVDEETTETIDDFDTLYGTLGTELTSTAANLESRLPTESAEKIAILVKPPSSGSSEHTLSDPRLNINDAGEDPPWHEILTIDENGDYIVDRKVRINEKHVFEIPSGTLWETSVDDTVRLTLTDSTDGDVAEVEFAMSVESETVTIEGTEYIFKTFTVAATGDWGEYIVGEETQTRISSIPDPGTIPDFIFPQIGVLVRDDVIELLVDGYYIDGGVKVEFEAAPYTLDPALTGSDRLTLKLEIDPSDPDTELTYYYTQIKNLEDNKHPLCPDGTCPDVSPYTHLQWEVKEFEPGEKEFSELTVASHDACNADLLHGDTSILSLVADLRNAQWSQWSTYENAGAGYAASLAETGSHTYTRTSYVSINNHGNILFEIEFVDPGLAPDQTAAPFETAVKVTATITPLLMPFAAGYPATQAELDAADEEDIPSEVAIPLGTPDGASSPPGYAIPSPTTPASVEIQDLLTVTANKTGFFTFDESISGSVENVENGSAATPVTIRWVKGIAKPTDGTSLPTIELDSADCLDASKLIWFIDSIESGTESSTVVTRQMFPNGSGDYVVGESSLTTWETTVIKDIERHFTNVSNVRGDDLTITIGQRS